MNLDSGKYAEAQIDKDLFMSTKKAINGPGALYPSVFC